MSLNLLISANARGLSQKNLFTSDRDVNYSRGIYLIIASNEQILTYLVNEIFGGYFIEFYIYHLSINSIYYYHSLILHFI